MFALLFFTAIAVQNNFSELEELALFDLWITDSGFWFPASGFRIPVFSFQVRFRVALKQLRPWSSLSSNWMVQLTRHLEGRAVISCK